MYLHRPDRGTTICIMCKFTFNINTYRICTNSCNHAILHLPKMVNVVLWGITGFWLFCYYIINIHSHILNHVEQAKYFLTISYKWFQELWNDGRCCQSCRIHTCALIPIHNLCLTGTPVWGWHLVCMALSGKHLSFSLHKEQPVYCQNCEQPAKDQSAEQKKHTGKTWKVQIFLSIGWSMLEKKRAKNPQNKTKRNIGPNIHLMHRQGWKLALATGGFIFEQKNTFNLRCAWVSAI